MNDEQIWAENIKVGWRCPKNHTHRLLFGTGNWVFFQYAKHYYPGVKEFTACRDGTRLYVHSSGSLKSLFRWVRAFEEGIEDE